MRTNKQVLQPEPLAQPTPYWVRFFRCQRSIMLRSQLVTALMAGTPLEAARAPAGALLDALLIALAARTRCDAEVVDDWVGLVTRAAEKWADPLTTSRTLDQVHADKASILCWRRGEDDGGLFAGPEVAYVPAMVAQWIDAEPPRYFGREL